MILLRISPLLLLLLAACDPNLVTPQSAQNQPSAVSPSQQTQNEQPSLPQAPQAQVPVVLNGQQLSSLGFRLPLNQASWDNLPPQPGQSVLGQVVKGGLNSDTNWTAFTLVLFLNEKGHYEVLTQKRAIAPAGVIETAGGHLTGGQSWRDGARIELEQEAGIKVDNANLFYLEGGNIKVSASSNKLFGNVNFFVVFAASKPKTQIHGHEVDRHYGHQWVSLKALYEDVLDEQNQLGFLKNGKYYGFFRTHVIHFVDKVLHKQFKANMLGKAA